VDALPPLLRDAVQEVHRFVQAPPALIVASALASLSLAVQGLVDVRRDAQLVGPVSIYLLSVAESGERKSTCDAIFARPLNEWEQERRTAMADEVASRGSRHGRIRREEGRPTGGDQAAAPQGTGHRRGRAAAAHPRRRGAARGAVAATALCRCDAGGVDVLPGQRLAERGRPVGRGPVRCSARTAWARKRSCATSRLLNMLWDGGTIAIDRRSKPSFRLRGRRLTFGLMVQPEALRGFLERAGTLPRGTGFLARFLVAWPESTQGRRHYRQAPAVLPAVERFSRRIRALLDEPMRTDEQGALAPTSIALTPAAQAKWIDIHDCIEDELHAAGEFKDIRDVASKAAENIARLAALFHVLQERSERCRGRPVDRGRDDGRDLASGRSAPAARCVGRIAVARRGSPARCVAACGSAAHAGLTHSDAADLPVRGPRTVRDLAMFKASMALLSLSEDGRGSRSMGRKALRGDQPGVAR
jgi:putative DNA primase/helicase